MTEGAKWKWTPERGQSHFCYDALNRATKKLFSTANCSVTTGSSAGGSSDVFIDYDLLGRPCRFRWDHSGGDCPTSTGTLDGVVSYLRDNAGRVTAENSSGRVLGYQYDEAGDRTRITWPDGFYAAYVYLANGRPRQILENGSTSLASFSFDYGESIIQILRGNSAQTTSDQTPWMGPTNISHGLGSSGVILNYSYDPVGGLTSKNVTGPAAYNWTNHPAVTTSLTFDRLNRDAGLASPNPPTCAGANRYDCKGDLLSDGTRNFTYDAEDRMLTASGPTAITLSYDPTGRLSQTVSSVTTQFLYSGDQLVAEYSPSPSPAGTVLHRYVPGPIPDQPVVWYYGSGTTDRRYLHQDSQGTVIAWSNSSAVAGDIYAYGPNGEPADNFAGGKSRFRYTGQIMIPEAQLYYYKARMYDPGMGRFLQADPTGYDAGMNLYAYTGDDPVNLNDPMGTEDSNPNGNFPDNDICGNFEHVVTGSRICGAPEPIGIFDIPGGDPMGEGSPAGPAGGRGWDPNDVIVKGYRGHRDSSLQAQWWYNDGSLGHGVASISWASPDPNEVLVRSSPAARRFLNSIRSSGVCTSPAFECITSLRSTGGGYSYGQVYYYAEGTHTVINLEPGIPIHNHHNSPFLSTSDIDSFDPTLPYQWLITPEWNLRLFYMGPSSPGGSWTTYNGRASSDGNFVFYINVQ